MPQLAAIQAARASARRCGAPTEPRFLSGTVQGASGTSSGIGASGQSSTRPAWPARSAKWRSAAGLCDAGGGDGIGEYRIDQRQHRRRGAERHVELDVTPFRTGVADTLPQDGAPMLELVGIGALEGIDRLLAVADGEDRAVGRDRCRRR